MAIEAFPALADLVTSLVIAFWRIAQLFVLFFCASGNKELHLSWFMLQHSILPSPFCHILLCEIFIILFICPLVCVCVFGLQLCVFKAKGDFSKTPEYALLLTIKTVWFIQYRKGNLRQNRILSSQLF